MDAVCKIQTAAGPVARTHYYYSKSRQNIISFLFRGFPHSFAQIVDTDQDPGYGQRDEQGLGYCRQRTHVLLGASAHARGLIKPVQSGDIIKQRVQVGVVYRLLSADGFSHILDQLSRGVAQRCGAVEYRRDKCILTS